MAEPIDGRIAGEVGAVIAVEPAHEAYLARLSGLPWRAVARKVGYVSATTARLAVKNYLERAAFDRSEDERREALELAIERSEAVLAAWWGKATEGHDKDAAALVLRTLDQLSRLQRLESQDAAPAARTIVIAGSPEEYAAQLRQVLERRKAAKAIEDHRVIEQ